jgi:hypothetical protein
MGNLVLCDGCRRDVTVLPVLLWTVRTRDRRLNFILAPTYLDDLTRLVGFL